MVVLPSCGLKSLNRIKIVINIQLIYAMKTFLLYALVFVALANGIHGQSNPEEQQRVCEPGTTTKVDCNTCTCAMDGSGLACTEMACPKIPAESSNPDGYLKLPHQINPLLRTEREQICEPGSSRVWNCNSCRCSKDGTTEICIRRVCPKVPRRRRDLANRCTPGKSFMDDCNTCFCSADGRVAGCTLMACEGILASSPKSERPSNPSIRSKRDQVCQPSSTRVWECNKCRCSSDGTAELCTKRVCPIVPRQKRDVPFSCVPNQHFMDDCNHCTCTPDGRGAMCTLMGCPPRNIVRNTPESSIAT